MGIPGGNKQEGIRQMTIGMERGVLLSVDIRFYLAANLRRYDQKYEQAITIAEPLVAKYPSNPIFLLLLGNLNVELSRSDKAAEYFHVVLNLPNPESTCTDCASCSNCATCSSRAREIANSFLASAR